MLQAQQNTQFKAVAKEAASAISGAFEAYKQNNALAGATTPSDLMPYLNYVMKTTSYSIDDGPGGTTRACTPSMPCLQLHSGAMLMMGGQPFTGTGKLNAVYFLLDPDGKADGTASGPGKSLTLILYATGRISTMATMDNGTLLGGMAYPPQPGSDPAWFDWN